MKIKYQPEIDGLRAIAVCSVILYHSKINISNHYLFEGGFIGVDIFFVISGYLITFIILKELVSTNCFSFQNFFEKRIRRILPALLVVMLSSFPIAWILLMPDDFVDFSKSILYSIGYSSNIYFYYTDQQYGAVSGLLKPFLHTWSLAIEEQFYILFPIILLIVFKYFKKYLIFFLITSFIISLTIADWTSRNYSSLSFYFIHTRIWELLAGSILAYFEISRGFKNKNKILKFTMPSMGFILIVCSILLFDKETFHPSFHTLFPIIGVCLIIWFSDKDELITKILTSKLLVGIGLISYSLYLWHYPIFAFARISNIAENNIIIKIFIGLVILILSIISYYFIEKPSRNKKNSFKKLVTIFFVIIIFLVSQIYYVVSNNGIKTRLPNLFQDKLKETKIKLFQKNNLQKIVLIGDSHSDALLYNLNKESDKKNFSLYRFNTGLYLKDFNYINKKTKKINKGFFEINNEIENFLKNNSNLIIIYHARWSLRLLETFFSNELEGVKEKENLSYHQYLEHLNIKSNSTQQRQELIKNNLISQVKKIINQGHKLILVYPVPEMGFDVPSTLLLKFNKQRLLSRNKNTIDILSTSYEVYKKRHKLFFEIFDNIQLSNLYKIYPDQLFCNTIIINRCVANNKETIFYFDDDHLSIGGSKIVVDEIMKLIKNF